jgi:hypothetical protein
LEKPPLVRVAFSIGDVVSLRRGGLLGRDVAQHSTHHARRVTRLLIGRERLIETVEMIEVVLKRGMQQRGRAVALLGLPLAKPHHRIVEAVTQVVIDTAAHRPLLERGRARARGLDLYFQVLTVKSERGGPRRG